MKIIPILLIPFILTPFHKLKADCEGMEYYVPVTIVFKNNTVRDTYILFSYDWKIQHNWQDNACRNDGCTGVIYYNGLMTAPGGNIIIYDSLIIPHEHFPFHGYAFTRSSVDTISMNEILKIELKKSDLFVYSGAVFIIPDELVDMILSEPCAYIMIPADEDLKDTYIISYNPKIDRDKLDEIQKAGYAGREKELEKQKVLIAAYYNCSY